MMTKRKVCKGKSHHLGGERSVARTGKCKGRHLGAKRSIAKSAGKGKCRRLGAGRMIARSAGNGKYRHLGGEGSIPDESDNDEPFHLGGEGSDPEPGNDEPTLPNPAQIIPSTLVKYIQGDEQQSLTLRDSKKKLWDLKIKKMGEVWYFTDGWRQFLRNTKIRAGDVIMFEHASEGVLDFQILRSPSKQADAAAGKRNTAGTGDAGGQGDVAAGKRNAAGGQGDAAAGKRNAAGGQGDAAAGKRNAAGGQGDAAAGKRNAAGGQGDGAGNLEDPIKKEDISDVDDDDDGDDDSVEELSNKEDDNQKAVDEAGNPKKKRKTRTIFDYYCTEIFDSGVLQQPTNPYFVTRLRRDRSNELYIPTDVIKCHDIQLTEWLVLVDDRGRRFKSKRSLWKDGRSNFVGGWKSICRVNSARKEDKILCEFLNAHTNDPELLISVRFVR